ncbi:MAG: carboxypeptidase-like regulatory domain-containing protein [Bacteroidota bacterium]
MFRKFVVTFALGFLLPALLIAQDGKLRGRVTDKEAGEPLIGANVVLEGTTLGASTDINGDYIILSIPPGTYTVKASYIGYSPLSISNLRFSSNLTTTQDIQLSSTAIQVDAVEIVAVRPLIQRNTTNTVRIADSEDIKNLPIRGVQNLVALNAGVVQQNGQIHVRGGRVGEVAYMIDGATTTNPLGVDPFGGSDATRNSIEVIQESIQEMQVQTGGYTAEYGGSSAGSGIVQTTMKTGQASKYNFSLTLENDGGTESSANSYGYSNVVGTAGGGVPYVDGLTFFGAGRYLYQANRSRRFLEPFTFTNLRDDGLNYPIGTLLPKSPWASDSGTIDIKRNTLPNNWQENYSLQGNLFYSGLQNVKIKFTGSFDSDEIPLSTGWPTFLNNYFLNENRYMIRTEENAFANLRVTYIASPTTFVEVQAKYQTHRRKDRDQQFWNNWQSYADSAQHVAVGNKKADGTGYFVNRYSGPNDYSIISRFSYLNHPYSANNYYDARFQDDISLKIDAVSQLTKEFELKVGGNLDWWTYRWFYVGSVSGYRTAYDVNEDGVFNNQDDYFTYTEYEQRVRASRAATIYSIGYKWNDGSKTVDEDEIDGNNIISQGPGKPFLASAYLQGKYEVADMTINAGFRVEHFAPNASVPVTTPNNDYDYNHYVVTQPDSTVWDNNLKFLGAKGITKSKSFTMILPRINLSFPVTDNTVFYSQYGQYAHMPDLNLLYLSYSQMSARLNPGTRSPYNLGESTLGFSIEPEYNTQFEIGFRQALTDNLAITVTGFYKDLRNQLQIGKIYNNDGDPVGTSFQNYNFGTVKGLEFTLVLRRTERMSANVSYTLSDGKGTGSSRRSSQNSVTDSPSDGGAPNVIVPLDHNQTHRGSVSLDYRFARGDGGPVLEGLGAMILATFNSGHPYTRVDFALGQSNQWNVGIEPLSDSRQSHPVEAVNNSITPWFFNVDLNLSKVFYLDAFSLEIYAGITNLFNTKHVINVYPTTGSPNDDGWLKNPNASQYTGAANYEEFYRAINLDNRWALLGVASDVYGNTRQIKFGLRFEY